MGIDRGKWMKRRFGHIDESILGKVEDLKGTVSIDLTKSCHAKGRTLTYRMIEDIRRSAGRIAEIFQNGAYEMINNSELEWHHHPEQIIQKVQTGDWNFYGCYRATELIAVED